jgi:hypothetical protein
MELREALEMLDRGLESLQFCNLSLGPVDYPWKFFELNMKKLWWLVPIALLGVYFMPLIGGKIIAPLDITQFYAPWSKGVEDVKVHNHFTMDFPVLWFGERLFAWQAYREDGWIGWSDLTFSGTAQYANTMNMYYDWNMQLNRWLPFWDAWHLGLFGHLLTAAAGMMVFLRSRDISEGASLLGALCFSMNSLFFTWMFHSWMLGAFCWLPWVMWSLYELRGKKLTGLLAPVFLCLGFFGGHLQFAAFYVIITVALCLFWVWEDFKKYSFKSLAWFLVFGAVGLLAAGMAAIMFVPCTSAYLETLDAGLKRGGIGYPGGWFQPFGNLLIYPLYIFSFFLGRPQSMDFAKIFESGLLDTPFIGSLPIILALIYGFRVIAKKGGDRAVVLFMVLGLLLPLTPLVGPLYQRLLIIFVFGACWGAACALDQQEILRSPKISTFLWRAFCVVSGIWAIVSAAIWTLQSNLEQKLAGVLAPSIANHRFAIFQDWWNARIERTVQELQIWHPQMIVPWVALGVALFFYRSHASGRVAKSTFLAVMISTTAIQLFWFNKNWISFYEKPAGDIPSFAGQDFLQEHVQPWHRVAVIQKEGRPRLFNLNTLSWFEIPHLSGYGSIVPAGIQRGVPMYTFAKDLDPAFFGNLGVTHAIGFYDEADLGDGWELIGREGAVSLFENTLARSRYEAVTDSGAIGLDPAVHESNYRRLALPPNTTQLNVIENWGQGWEFRMDSGDWVPLKRAEDRTMVAEFSSSPVQTILEMRYRPTAMRIGQSVSLLSLGAYLLVCAVWLALLRRKRTAGATSAP